MPVIAEVKEISQRVVVSVYKELTENVQESNSYGQEQEDFQQKSKAGDTVIDFLGSQVIRVLHQFGKGGDGTDVHGILHHDGGVARRAGNGQDNEEIHQNGQDGFSPVAAKGREGGVFEKSVRFHLFDSLS